MNEWSLRGAFPANKTSPILSETRRLFTRAKECRIEPCEFRSIYQCPCITVVKPACGAELCVIHILVFDVSPRLVRVDKTSRRPARRHYTSFSRRRNTSRAATDPGFERTLLSWTWRHVVSEGAGATACRSFEEDRSTTSVTWQLRLWVGTLKMRHSNWGTGKCGWWCCWQMGVQGDLNCLHFDACRSRRLLLDQSRRLLSRLKWLFCSSHILQQWMFLVSHFSVSHFSGSVEWKHKSTQFAPLFILFDHKLRTGMRLVFIHSLCQWEQCANVHSFIHSL